MEVVRRIIFYVFLIAYVILCPLLILYSLGYVVYPLKEKMVHTGVVYLASWPSGAEVFLEKSHFKEKTPATIRDLLPGEYTIRLELKDHRSWTQKVRVEDGKAAVFDKILLIPNTWKQRGLLAENFHDLIPLIGTEYFLLSQSEQLKDQYVYDWKKETVQHLPGIPLEQADFRVSAFFSREESPIVLIQGGPLWDRKYFYTQVNGQGSGIRDISKLITQRPLNMEWTSSSRDTVFALYEGQVDRVDTVSSSFYPKYIEDVHGLGLSRDQIYIIDRNNDFLASPVSKKDFKTVLENRELAGIFAREKDFYEIQPVNGNSFVFLGSRSAVILSHSKLYFISEPLIGARQDPASDKLLVWTRKAIGILDLSDEDDEQGQAPERNFTKISWVLVQGRDIRQCFWAYEGSHVIFRDGNDIFLLESEPQGPFHLEPVTSGAENASMMYVKEQGVLYYLGARDGKLYALDVVPRKWPGQTPFREEPSAKKSEQ